MQQININELKPHPRNNEFFDDMSGEKWNEFLDSVKSRGVIEPIVITPDKVIVSGHQRVRACKELGISDVMCDVHTYDNEDQILQDLLETNIRQRGDVGGSAKKVGLRIKELERIYGIHQGNGSNQHEQKPNNSVIAKSQSDIASQMGISTDTLQNYKMLADMIPELEELLDTGIVTKTTALAMIRNLSEEDQENFIASLDTTKKITQREVQKYIDEIKELKSKKPETKTVEKIIDNTDYSLENKNKELEKQAKNNSDTIKTLQNENKRLKSENKTLEFAKKVSDDLAGQYKSQSDEYMKVKEKLTHMGLKPDGDYNTFQATVQITELNNELLDLLQNKLAPIKYKEYIFAVKKNSLLRQNFLNTLSFVNDWYLTMLSYFGEEPVDNNIIDMEEI